MKAKNKFGLFIWRLNQPLIALLLYTRSQAKNKLQQIQANPNLMPKYYEPNFQRVIEHSKILQNALEPCEIRQNILEYSKPFGVLQILLDYFRTFQNIQALWSLLDPSKLCENILKYSLQCSTQFYPYSTQDI